MKHSSEALRNLHDAHYANDYERKPLQRLARLSKYFRLSPHDCVVDYACGNAMLLDVIHDKVGEYHGVDFSEDMLVFARNRSSKYSYPPTFFHSQSIEDFASHNTYRFDAAFALDLSEHVYDEEWLAILRAVRLSLKPGGNLYIHTPNRDYFIERFKEIGLLSQFPEHVAVRTIEQNVRLLQEAGFANTHVRLLSHYELRQKPFAALAPIPLIGKFFEARIFITATA